MLKEDSDILVNKKSIILMTIHFRFGKRAIFKHLSALLDSTHRPILALRVLEVRGNCLEVGALPHVPSLRRIFFFSTLRLVPNFEVSRIRPILDRLLLFFLQLLLIISMNFLLLKTKITINVCRSFS